jgi:hypothetical protein
MPERVMLASMREITARSYAVEKSVRARERRYDVNPAMN